MMSETDLEASARMAEVSTPSRFTLVDTFRHGILARFLFLLSATASGWPPSPPLLCSAHCSLVSAAPLPLYPPATEKESPLLCLG